MKRTAEELFWANVRRLSDDECWVWTRFRDRDGYGRTGLLSDTGSPTPAHRVAYRLVKGDIPAGLQIDHLCRNRACVNPSHLEAVTGRVNTLRGDTAAARLAARDSCNRGHLFDSANTRVRKDGSRACRACHRQWQREYLQRKAAS